MSQEMKDVCVCFRPVLEVGDVMFITHRLLQDFPRRILPEFRPWFPSASDVHRPIRPRRLPPVIHSEESIRFRRSWCVMMERSVPLRLTSSLSGPFRRSVEQLGLDPRQRVRWVVEEQNCGGGQLERLWMDINRSIRRSRLPTCNANFQRALAQIWLYCDVLYCEYIGNFLKQEFQLSGQITLTAHKLGDILQL